MNTIAQIEYADAYSDPLPAGDTFDRMKTLCHEHDNEIIFTKNRRMWVSVLTRDAIAEPDAVRRLSEYRNQLTQSQLRLAELNREIVEVARLIVAEADNQELMEVKTI